MKKWGSRSKFTPKGSCEVRQSTKKSSHNNLVLDGFPIKCLPSSKGLDCFFSDRSDTALFPLFESLSFPRWKYYPSVYLDQTHSCVLRVRLVAQQENKHLQKKERKKTTTQKTKTKPHHNGFIVSLETGSLEYNAAIINVIKRLPRKCLLLLHCFCRAVSQITL